MENFCRRIVFDLVSELQPTPPPAPDLTRVEIRKRLFEEKNAGKRFVFDRFVDRYGLNLFRNMKMILAIFKNKDLVRFISINNGLISNQNKAISEHLEVFNEENHKSRSNLRGSDSIEIKNKKENNLKPKTEQSVPTREMSRKHRNITSNVVSHVADSKPETWHQKTQKSAEKASVTPEQVIAQVFNSGEHTSFADSFWDMSMESLLALKEQILENCESFGSKAVGDIAESIEHRLQILRDACLVRKPESSILYEHLRQKTVDFCEFVIQEVDERRAELDLPPLGKKAEQAEEDSQSRDREKVRVNIRRKRSTKAKMK